MQKVMTLKEIKESIEAELVIIKAAIALETKYSPYVGPMEKKGQPNKYMVEYNGKKKFIKAFCPYNAIVNAFPVLRAKNDGYKLVWKAGGRWKTEGRETWRTHTPYVGSRIIVQKS